MARFILTGAEKDGDAQREAEHFGDILFTDDRLSGYRSIVHKTYFVLEYVVRTRNRTPFNPSRLSLCLIGHSRTASTALACPPLIMRRGCSSCVWAARGCCIDQRVTNVALMI